MHGIAFLCKRFAEIAFRCHASPATTIFRWALATWSDLTVGDTDTSDVWSTSFDRLVWSPCFLHATISHENKLIQWPTHDLWSTRSHPTIYLITQIPAEMQKGFFRQILWHSWWHPSLEVTLLLISMPSEWSGDASALSLEDGTGQPAIPGSLAGCLGWPVATNDSFKECSYGRVRLRVTLRCY